ncbi:MAG: hypothetical protein JW895_06460 [Thermoleophilaceae bacterium]|nr:hypothetical protein [Thermoleophilaceae bacterium]
MNDRETDAAAPPGAGKDDPEADQRANDEADTQDEGPGEDAVEKAREELKRVREAGD